MDVEQWTDIETLDCKTAGFRVAVALAMTGIRKPIPGPEFQHVYGTLKHCTGALKCGFTLPATAGDLVLSACPVADRIHRAPKDEPYRRSRAGGRVLERPLE